MLTEHKNYLLEMTNVPVLLHI